MHKGTPSYGIFSSKSLTWESNAELEIALKYVMDARASGMCKLHRTEKTDAGEKRGKAEDVLMHPSWGNTQGKFLLNENGLWTDRRTLSTKHYKFGYTVCFRLLGCCYLT